MFAKDFDDKTICPMMSDGNFAVYCVRERCALWVKSNNEKYSACAVQVAAFEAKQTHFAVEGRY